MKRIRKTVDSFDLIMLTVIVMLLTAIGLIILRGQVRRTRLVYLGPKAAMVQNLYAVDLAQSAQPEQLTEVPGGIVSYGVAVDGSSIIYSVPEGRINKLYLLDLNGGTSRLVFSCDDSLCTDPVFRPDGRAVAFLHIGLNSDLHVPPGPPHVWTLDLASGRAQPVLRDKQRFDLLYRWSPDGKQIAILDNNASEIIVHDVLTDTDRVLPNSQGHMWDFSPDGKWLAYPRLTHLNNTRTVVHPILADMAAAQFTARELVPETDSDSYSDVVWSADSYQVFVVSESATQNAALTSISSINVETGQRHVLISNMMGKIQGLTVSPSGDKLLIELVPLDSGIL